MPELDGGTVRFRATGDPAERAAGRLTLTMIRDALAHIVEQRATDDPNLHYLDGRDLYGETDFAELPLPDGVHPDPAGHRRIAENFGRLVFGEGVPSPRELAEIGRDLMRPTGVAETDRGQPRPAGAC